MMYADYDFYRSSYGGTTITTETAYAKYAEIASDFMDFVTRARLSDNLPSDTAALKAIKRCECALADLYKEVEDIRSSSSIVTGGGTIKSMSSGGESVTLEPSALQEAVSGGELEIRKYLLQTVRMYLSGVADDEGHYYFYWGI